MLPSMLQLTSGQSAGNAGEDSQRVRECLAVVAVRDVPLLTTAAEV